MVTHDTCDEYATESCSTVGSTTVCTYLFFTSMECRCVYVVVVNMMWLFPYVKYGGIKQTVIKYWYNSKHMAYCTTINNLYIVTLRVDE